MKIVYLKGETVREASEINDVSEFFTTAQALRFFAGRTVTERENFIPTSGAGDQELPNIEATFDNLIEFMLIGASRIATGYGPMDFNPRHTNFILDSLTALREQTPETLKQGEGVYAQFIAAAGYIMDNLEVEGLHDSTTELVLASSPE